MAGNRLITLAKVQGDNFVVDSDSLFNFLQKDEIQGKPLVIVSIAGISRSGKSFIMNFFLRYLRNKGWENKAWFGDESSPISGGFPSKRGENACTQGITVWSEVFNVPLENGREVCVILVDTQGLYDNDTSPDINMKLMSLSTMLCSHQIFNLVRQINEPDLEHLNLCIECAKVAGGMNSGTKPFQSLTFLIRDWQSDNDYGENSEGCLKRFFDKKSNSTHVQQLKDLIPGAFSNLECTVLPDPGKAVKTPKEGEVLTNKNLDEEFLEHTVNFVDRVLNPNNLVIKQSKGGREETTTGLLNLLTTFSRAFEAGKVPKQETILESFVRSQNTKALNESVRVYRREMEKTCNGIMDKKTLEYHHAAAIDLATQHFRAVASMSHEACRVSFLDQLKTECGSAFESYKRENDDRKARKIEEFRDTLHDCEASYAEKIKEIRSDVTEATFDDMNRRFHCEAVSNFERATKNHEEKMPEIKELRKELEDSIGYCHTYAKGKWKDEKLSQKSRRQYTSEDYMDKLVREYQGEVNKYEAHYKRDLDGILEGFKNQCIQKYERKMAFNDDKDTSVLLGKLNNVKKRAMQKNTVNKRQAVERFRNIGRKHASEFEATLRESMDKANIKETIIDKSKDEFLAKLREDEQYKALPKWGKQVAKEQLNESAQRLKEENERNRKHRNVVISNWEKFCETMTRIFRKVFRKRAN